MLAFSWEDNVIVLINSILLFAKFLFCVLSIVCKSNLGHPDLTKVLQIPGFLFAKAIKVLVMASHNSSSFTDLDNNFINELTYNSDGIVPFSSAN